MLNIQKRNLSRKVVAAVAATLLCNTLTAQAMPANNACSHLTRTRIAEFRADLGTETSGAIALLKKANAEGGGLGGGGAWQDPSELLVIADSLDETAFLAPPCKSLFYPSSPDFGSSAGTAVPNNIHACFRVGVAPHLEYAMYLATLHAWYNKESYPSGHSAKKAFYAVRNLLRESRSVSNDALTCLFQSTGDKPLVGP